MSELPRVIREYYYKNDEYNFLEYYTSIHKKPYIKNILKKDCLITLLSKHINLNLELDQIWD